jgi:hypothetical protein
MAKDASADRFDSLMTRRTVVRTGAKLAYAAPVVAASFRLESSRALAYLSGECSETGQLCGGENVSCSCTRSSNNSLICANDAYFCDDSTGQSCNSDADCEQLIGTGWFCHDASAGFCGQICLPKCEVNLDVVDDTVP